MRAHGTRSRYNNNRCRCDACTAANQEYAKQAKVLALVPVKEEDTFQAWATRREKWWQAKMDKLESK
jgi:hypothetical protein